MRRILDYLPPQRLLQVGVRSCSKEEADFAEQVRIKTYASEELIENPKGVAEDIIEKAGGRRVYLTIDLDVLDPAFAPGVATPEPGGPSAAELLRLIRGLEELDIIGCDVVELVPPYDDETSAFAAARIIYELLGNISKKK
jgi:agmatinase